MFHFRISLRVSGIIVYYLIFCYLLFIEYTELKVSRICVDEKRNFKLRVDPLRYRVSNQTLKIKKNVTSKVQFRL